MCPTVTLLARALQHQHLLVSMSLSLSLGPFARRIDDGSSPARGCMINYQVSAMSWRSNSNHNRPSKDVLLPDWDGMAWIKCMASIPWLCDSPRQLDIFDHYEHSMKGWVKRIGELVAAAARWFHVFLPPFLPLPPPLRLCECMGVHGAPQFSSLAYSWDSC